MLNEYDIYLYAAARAWTATIDFLHPDEYLRGVFLTRGTRTQLLGPLGAIAQLNGEQFFALLEQLEGEAKRDHHR